MNLLLQYKGLRRENYILCFGRLVTAMGAMVWPMLTMILSQKMGMSPEHISWVMALFGILSLPTNLIGGKMGDYFNKKLNIVFLDLISVVCYILSSSGLSVTGISDQRDCNRLLIYSDIFYGEGYFAGRRQQPESCISDGQRRGRAVDSPKEEQNNCALYFSG